MLYFLHNKRERNLYESKFKNSSNFPGNLYYKQCFDRREINHTTLFVSKGLGDTLPLHWNAPKEVVLVTVR